MSFEIFVQRLAGEAPPPPFARAAFDAAFSEGISGPPHLGCVVLSYPDDGGADAYPKDGAWITSIMMSRPSGRMVFDDLCRFMRETGTVALWPGTWP